LVFFIVIKMDYSAKPKLDDDGVLIGVILDITFDEIPTTSKSGKNYIDFSTKGNVLLAFEGETVRKMGINIYHKA